MMNNIEVFGTSEFEGWARPRPLIPEEIWLIDCYLSRQGRTLEGGTGGGSILCEMRKRGFHSLAGFDYVPALIEQARRNDASGSIEFTVQDAKQLRYRDHSFDQIVYLQQVISFLDHESQPQALTEAFRVLKPQGTALFSFLCFEARERSWRHRPYLLYLQTARWMSDSTRSRQLLPWLRLGGNFNLASLLDRGPFVYWFLIPEAEAMLTAAGFEICGMGTSHQVRRGSLCSGADALLQLPLAGMLYVVCRKRA
jgi:SAM-dependent methyltransferase